jgi:ethanolamine ammonia-lyase small subunit
MGAFLPDAWERLRRHTPARIALGRVGSSLPTREVLAFALAHARARDAVHDRFDRAELSASLQRLGLSTLELESRACDRGVYLRRPDLGRELEADGYDKLDAAAGGRVCDLALVAGDGLSARAVATQAPAMIAAFLPHVARLGLTLGPVVIAEGARVALGDDIASRLGARFAIVLIGERPGLSAADSMSAYLTFAPHRGRTDAERNCLSNIRPEGLAPAAAAHNLAWLVEAALMLGATGVALKDRSSQHVAVLGEQPEASPGQPRNS